MEPKDLKNPEGLKTTENSEPENVEKKKPVDTEQTTELEVQQDETTEGANQPELEKTETEKTEAVSEIEDEKEVVEQETTSDETSENEVVDESASESEEQVAEKQEIEEQKPEVEEITATEETSDVKEVDAEKTDEVITAQTEENEEPKQEKPVVAKEIKVEKKEKIDYSSYSQVELINAFRDILDNQSELSLHVKDEIEVIKAVFYKNLNESIEAAKDEFIEKGGVKEEFVAEQDPYENDIKDLLKRYRQIRIEFNKKLEAEKEDNLKLKYEVIENIKALINNEESINKTFNEFRDLQRQWRDIGLVPQSKMKNLWDTYHFHVENFYNYIKINKELRDLDLKKNLETKIRLCERAEELLVEPSIIKAFNTLQKYHERWREIGPVPIENKDDIWERFKTATAKINKKHQEFFEERKVDQKKNLEAKTALCEKVEEILTQDIGTHKEWDEKSRELIELQKVWRTIGFAPRKDNNKIYERFRTSCDKFFDAKREFYSKNKELQQNNLQLKIDMCVEAEALKDSDDWKKTSQDLIKLQRKWKEVGPVPRKNSDIVWKRFRAACDYFFEKKSEHFSSMDSEQVENLKLKEDLVSEVENFKPLENVEENLKILRGFQRRWTEIGHVPFKKKDDVQNKYREAINKLFDELNLDEEKRNLLKFRTKMNTFSESNRGQNKMRMEREKYMSKLKQLESDLVLLDNNIGFFAKSKNAESLIADVKKIEFIKEKIRVIDDIDK